MLSLMETYINAYKNYFSQNWKDMFRVVKTLMAGVMGLLIFLLREKDFEVTETDLSCSCNPRYI